MEVNDALIDKLSALSKLKFEENEKESIKQDLQKMIGFVEKLQEVNTDGVEPLLHITSNINVLREDTAEKGLEVSTALSNAANKSGEYFLVPKVINK